MLQNQPIDKRMYHLSIGIEKETVSDLAISVAVAKQWVRVAHDLEDGLIELILRAAINHAEEYTSYLFVERSVTEYYKEFPAMGEALTLSMHPVTEVASVSYGDTTMDLSDLVIETGSRPVFILPVSSEWPTISDNSLVKVEYTAGHADTDDIPPDLLLATLKIFAEAYDNRADFHQRFRSASEVLLDKYRLRVFNSSKKHGV